MAESCCLSKLCTDLIHLLFIEYTMHLTVQTYILEKKTYFFLFLKKANKQTTQTSSHTTAILL